MHAKFQAADTPPRRVEVARAYFFAVSALVFGSLVVGVARILTATQYPAEILFMNVGMFVTGILVSVLLTLAARMVRRQAQRGAVVASIAFLLLLLGAPMLGAAGVLVSALAIIGIALAVSALRMVRANDTASPRARAG